MKRFYVLSVLALMGVALAIYAVMDTNRPAATPPVSNTSAVVPFHSFVAGVGITEIGRGNVSIGTAVSGVVTDLYVRVADQVKMGDPLFRIDDRDLHARLAVARAKVHEAEATLAKPRHRLEFLTRLQRQDNSAISEQAISDVRDDARAADSALQSAKAQAAQIAVDIERCLVRAPLAGRILQINTRVGEYVEGAGQAKPLMLLGDDARIYLRVDIDENDAWRVRSSAAARAFVRGNPQRSVALRFEYLEPYVAPKNSLTGQSTERTDVRVLQAIYSFERTALEVYLGQQMDVFIEAQATDAPAAGSQTR